MIAGAFSSTSGKADTVLTTNGDILYYNNGRQRLPKEDNDDVLTLKSGLPSWEAASSGASLSASQTFTGVNQFTSGSEFAGGKMSFLFSNILSSAGTAFATYTPTSGLNMATTWAKIIIQIQGATVSAGSLNLKVNNLTDYDFTQILNDSTVLSGVQTTTAGLYEIIPSAISTNGDQFIAACEIGMMEDNEGSSKFQYLSSAKTRAQGNVVGGGNSEVDVSDQLIDTIIVSASANLDENTELLIYGVRR